MASRASYSRANGAATSSSGRPPSAPSKRPGSSHNSHVESSPDFDTSQISSEVFQKGIDLGFLPHDDNQWAEYGWVADELARVKPPEPWSEYSDDKGQPFFYDHNTGKARTY
jgi:hypothetical protein